MKIEVAETKLLVPPFNFHLTRKIDEKLDKNFLRKKSFQCPIRL